MKELDGTETSPSAATTTVEDRGDMWVGSDGGLASSTSAAVIVVALIEPVTGLPPSVSVTEPAVFDATRIKTKAPSSLSWADAEAPAPVTAALRPLAAQVSVILQTRVVQEDVVRF